MDHVVYMRVSTQQQGHSGLGLAAQKDIVMRFLGNTPPLAEFVEVESGKQHKNRPELLAALELCKKKKARLVIAKLDRLARNVAFISALMESGVEFVCCDNPHANRLMLHLLAAFAEHEREIISERIKAALGRVKADLALNGHRVSRTGRVYTKLGGPNLHQARIKAAEARRGRTPSEHVTEFMTQLREAGRSLRYIAAELNRWELKTGHGSRWYASTVRATLARLPEFQKARNDESTHAVNDDCVLSRNTSSGLNGLGSRDIPSAVRPSAGRSLTTDGVHMPINIPEGLRMLDVFASVGAREFVLTKLDMNQDKIWAKTYSAKDLRDKLPAMMRTAERRESIATPTGNVIFAGENVIIRPKPPEATFVQLDDLNEAQLDRVRPASFLIVSTSPGKYQAWISAEGVGNLQSKEFIRRVHKAVGGVDQAASGATRIAGSENFKEKYSPAFPIITICHAMPGRVMTEESLMQLGLIAESEPEPVKQWTTPATSYTHGRVWPSYEKCLAGAPLKNDGSGPDRSKADYTFAKFAAQRGFTVDEIAAELPNVSSRAWERLRNDPGYIKVTAQNGYDAAMRGKPRMRA